MRDQHDTETADAFAPKRGRPCKLDTGPMTEAQRARRYRSRVRSAAGLARAQADRDLRRGSDSCNFLGDYSDAQLLEAIRITLAEVRDFDRKHIKAKAARLVAELARRYPA